tara:strand:+ start:8859 stop:9590 length:732 start_codon:yes stop_codon:yes gene_type:complete
VSLKPISNHLVKSLKLKNLGAEYHSHYAGPNLLKFLAAPDYYFFNDKCEHIKNDQTTTVVVDRELMEHCPIVIKRYNTKNTWHAIRRTIRQSRAENCWIYAKKLEEMGVKVAPPIAFIQEYIKAGLKGRSWYLTEYVDAPSFATILSCEKKVTDEEKVIEQIIETLSFLWKHDISHGDTKNSNFLLFEDEIFVIDLDGMKQHKSAQDSAPSIRKDIARFLRNYRDKPELFNIASKKIRRAGFS